MYIALEIKDKADGTVEVSNYKKATRDEAEQAYHSILSVAAVSAHPVHTGMILNTMGQVLKSECYKHEQQAEE